MIACLRSARFLYPDYSASIFIELRRIHDTAARANNKSFLVTRRLGQTIISKSFDTLPEARLFWKEEVTKLEDSGMLRRDVPIAGFHEED